MGGGVHGAALGVDVGDRVDVELEPWNVDESAGVGVDNVDAAEFDVGFEEERGFEG